MRDQPVDREAEPEPAPAAAEAAPRSGAGATDARGGTAPRAGSDPGSGGDRERHRTAERPSIKVVDRRFWARQEGSAAEREDTGGRPRYPKFVEELQQRLEESQTRLADLSAAYRLQQQQTEEIHQRLQRDLERRLTLAKGELFTELLEVADNLERALGATHRETAGDDLVRGVGQVLAQLQRLLRSHGVEPVEMEGMSFDPEVAEAIEVRQVREEGKDGIVLEVLQRGYRHAGRMLRAARVVVGRSAARRPHPGAGAQHSETGEA
ncbi:MAG: nucleotide exchange factor GrpE [Acidobacteriota bacterium]